MRFESSSLVRGSFPAMFTFTCCLTEFGATPRHSFFLFFLEDPLPSLPRTAGRRPYSVWWTRVSFTCIILPHIYLRHSEGRAEA